MTFREGEAGQMTDTLAAEQFNPLLAPVAIRVERRRQRLTAGEDEARVAHAVQADVHADAATIRPAAANVRSSAPTN